MKKKLSQCHFLRSEKGRHLGKEQVKNRKCDEFFVQRNNGVLCSHLATTWTLFVMLSLPRCHQLIRWVSYDQNWYPDSYIGYTSSSGMRGTLCFWKKNRKVSLIPAWSKSFSQFSFWGECLALSNSGPIFPDPSSDLFKRCCSSKYQFAQLQTDHFYGTNQTVSI